MMAGGPVARCAEALAADCARQQKQFTAPGRRSSAARTTAPRYCWLCSACLPRRERQLRRQFRPRDGLPERGETLKAVHTGSVASHFLSATARSRASATCSRRPACASGVPTGECPQEPPRTSLRQTHGGRIAWFGRAIRREQAPEGADMTDAAPGRRSHVIISGITTVIYVHGFSGSRVW